MSVVIKMPQLAAGEETATVQSWLVEAGDTVAEGQEIAEIETEKAVVDFESEGEGVFAGHLVEAGETVDVGTPIAVIAAEGEDLEAALAEHGAKAAAAAEPEAASAPAESTSVASEDAVQTEEPEDLESPQLDTARRFASPLARKLAKERGIELDDLVGSGPGGRVVRRDVDAHEPAEPKPAARAAATASDSPAEASEGAAFEDVPHSRMRKAIARRLTESKGTVPHYYLSADVRMDALLELRKQANATSSVKISVNDFVIKAVAASLQDVPDANAIWTDDAVRRFSGVDISVAVSVPGGLVTPVLRSVHTKSLSTISAEMKDYALRAREGSLKQDELVGGSFSVSNLGMYGTREFSAIINPPQSGILAVGAAAKRAVVNDDGELGVATVMTVTLSADHRVLDGALAAEWLAAFVSRVESPVGLLV